MTFLLSGKIIFCQQKALVTGAVSVTVTLAACRVSNVLRLSYFSELREDEGTESCLLSLTMQRHCALCSVQCVGGGGGGGGGNT